MFPQIGAVDETEMYEELLSQIGVDSLEHIANFVESLDEN